MTFKLEFLSTRSGKALLFSQNNKRFLFGYYEGFQRHAIERNIRLSKIDQIFFFTHFEMVPFLGFFLTVADMGKKEIYLNGPNEISRIYNYSRSFAERNKLKVNFQYKNESVLEFHSIKGMNYIIKTDLIPGKLNISKLDVDFPVKLRKDLKERKTVFYNNKEYNGSDYMENDIIIGNICILFTIHNLEKILFALKEENVKIIICMNEETRIICKHVNNIKIIYFKDNQEIEYQSAYELQKKLNKLDFHYLLPKKNIKYTNNSVLSNELMEKNTTNDRTINLDIGMKELSSEIQCFTDSHFLTFSKKHMITEMKNDNFSEKVIFLGTGSAIPSKYRNVSAILYEQDDFAFLFDCGEDTLAQIDRVNGNISVLGKLKYIFISHSHADHHLGLVNLLRKISHSLTLICPKRVQIFIQIFNFNIEFIVTDSFSREDITEIDNNLKIKLCPVDHTIDSFAITIHANKTISYSGDCRPSFLFSQISKNVDLMIHEATFSDELSLNAIEHKHSTISEAIDIFRKSNAKELILTHFSQRFAKEIPFTEQVFYAFDFFMYNFKNKFSTKILEHFKKSETED